MPHMTQCHQAYDKEHCTDDDRANKEADDDAIDAVARLH